MDLLPRRPLVCSAIPLRMTLATPPLSWSWFPHLTARKMDLTRGFPGGASGKGPACRCRLDTGSIPGLGRSPGGEQSNPLQYSCPEDPMDREAWQAAVHSTTQSQTQLKQLSKHAHSLTSGSQTWIQDKVHIWMQ